MDRVLRMHWKKAVKPRHVFLKLLKSIVFRKLHGQRVHFEPELPKSDKGAVKLCSTTVWNFTIFMRVLWSQISIDEVVYRLVGNL